MNKQSWSRIALVGGCTLIAVLFAIPESSWGDSWFGSKMKEFHITLGLDLAGGTELDYKIDLSDAIAQNNDDDPQNDVNLDSIAESVRDALERRVNPAGVGEIVVKRSQINDEQHVLIQMPPSSNVIQAKKDAERDNRLEFFAEDPSLEIETRALIKQEQRTINPSNWDRRVAELADGKKIIHQVFEPRWADEIHDPTLKETLLSARAGTILPELIETQTELEYTVDKNGQLQIQSPPRPLLALVYVTSKKNETREKTIPAEVEARHILFGFPGATRAADDIKYADETTARTEAEKMLQRLQTEGTDSFEDLAKEFSTEAAAQESGGDLGTFSPGRMVPAFDEAVFADTTEVGLLDSIVETEFGFHVIEILAITPEHKETSSEPRVGYELLGWDRSELGWRETGLGGAQMESSIVGYDEIGQPIVNLLFNTEGGEMFANITEDVASRSCNGGVCRLGIKVGGEWITTPTVRQKIIGTSAQISGSFTFESAKELSDGLNLGAIDAPVKLAGQLTIEPSMGEDQFQKSLRAGAFGLIATLIFMIIMYRFAGFIAAIALILYVGLYIFILKIWPASFGGPVVISLAGMAGLALSIGLAVDGNILIFERLKEELNNGRSLRESIDMGFDRAWTAIRDSNITTLITCLILYNLGSAMIRGFAVTLIVGTLLSMFSAVILSRNLLRLSLKFKFLNNPSWFGASNSSKK